MTPTDTTLPVDIVLLPEPGQAALAVQCSEILSPQGTLFTLDNQNFFAHASMYMFQMDVSKQDECIASLQKIAKEHNVQTLAQNGYYYQDMGFGKGYVDANYSRNIEADRLQQTIIDAFNPHRAGMRESDKAKMADATDTKLENLQKYGYPAIGELFRPHITLTKIPQDIEPDLTPLPSPTSFTGAFTKLGLFEMGDNGTCIRHIASFNLKTN